MNASVLVSLAFVVGVASVFLSGRLPTPPPRAIGMDLGTTYSCVAIIDGETGSTRILADDDGSVIIPSIIAFLDNGKVIAGNEAKNQSILNPKNTIFDAKRIIGRKYDEIVQDTVLDLYPFSIINQDNEPLYEIETGNTRSLIPPQQVSAILLQKLKDMAERRINRKFTQVVMAIPVEFNEAQRNATVEAAKLAGLEVIRTIYEPSAAAMAYGLHKHKNVNNVLVFDFGGGTLDVSLLSVENGIFSVLANHGDKHLGGEDFNHNLMNHFMNIIQQKYNKDVTNDKYFSQQLRKEVERIKLALSEEQEVYVETEQLGMDKSARFIFTRKEFEELNSELFERMLVPVIKVLTKSGMKVDEVDEIVLVGGTTRMPKVREELSKFFNGKILNSSINPDEAVARGTAIQAGILTDTKRIGVGVSE